MFNHFIRWSSSPLILLCFLSFQACKSPILESNEPVSLTQEVTYDLDQLRKTTTSERSLGGISLTTDFQNWLNTNGYGSYEFVRTDITDDSYGGRTTAQQAVTRQPVIFIHGNSDKALGDSFGQSGWTNSILYFLDQGYTSAELYAITWGPADALQAADQTHSKAYVLRIRKFIEAVLAYTGADQVDLISHSMGVTLTRQAVLGGTAYDQDEGYYTVGHSLTDSVDAFVGIAGGNQGLTNCYFNNGSTPTCDDVAGFYPGYLWWGYGPYNVSDYLDNLNETSAYEGSYRYSIWSSADQVIGYGCLVYGTNTCRLPDQTGEKAYYSAPYGHFNLKDLTGSVQYQMVTAHIVP